MEDEVADQEEPEGGRQAQPRGDQLTSAAGWPSLQQLGHPSHQLIATHP